MLHGRDAEAPLSSSLASDEIVELTEVVEEPQEEVVLAMGQADEAGRPAVGDWLQEGTSPFGASAPEEDHTLDDLLASLKDFPEDLGPQAAAPPLSAASPVVPKAADLPGTVPSTPGPALPDEEHLKALVRELVQEVVERLAREIVPQVAETLVAREIKALKKRWAEED